MSGRAAEIEEWIFDARLQGMAETTIQQYSWVLRTAPFELPGTLTDAKAWLAELQGKGLSSSTQPHPCVEAVRGMVGRARGAA